MEKEMEKGKEKEGKENKVDGTVSDLHTPITLKKMGVTPTRYVLAKSSLLAISGRTATKPT
jgi:hypothetical protein